MTWLERFPTTNARIASSLGLAWVFVLAALGGDLTGHALSETTTGALSFFLLAMMAADVAQFASKRYSDVRLATAKAQGPSPVTVEAPSRVSVTRDSANTDGVTIEHKEARP